MKKKKYVIQKHKATNLHYDLRLEKNNVLKSWAVPKLPPRKKGLKRLAIKVADHALSYAKFKGVIPEGQYGAGKVEIWDSGWYEEKEWKRDKIVVDVHGQKLKGEYALVQYKGRKNQWMFFKI